ncbi:hypothetical protein PENCOP_c003G02806 [Penicillium coprophilum]|uniref:Transcription factor domain-containing protein n=1 Tax=Penicillium coprophilum TaxID=36646 RepID=A0A1V6UYJ4_9EURO|nr:hypothetical protein PENCOP_c003G02806 [Penicillium coprophilum]
MSRSAKSIYLNTHDSFLPVRDAAAAICRDLAEFQSLMQHNLGVSVDSDPLSQEKGVCQTILTSLYSHTLLLTYRPFIILRAKLRKLVVESCNRNGKSFQGERSRMPTWLNEACDIAIAAARDAIHHISRASVINPPVQELRYHGFFIGSSIFVLICDALQDPPIISVHQPWIRMGIQCLHLMREGEPITSTLHAIDLALKKLAQRQMYPDMRAGESPESSVGMSSETGDDGTVSGNEGIDGSPGSIFLNDPPAPSLVTAAHSTLRNIGGSGPMDFSDLQWRIDPSMV